MSEKKVMKPVALAVGAALAGTFAISGTVNAADTAESPFQVASLEVGYMLGEGEGSCGAADDKEGEGKCGEGSCGGDKEGEGKCGEGSCGASDDKKGEGKCGEGSCGASDDKKGEGKCGSST
jgi:uncharacterized low-complexity protein